MDKIRTMRALRHVLVTLEKVPTPVRTWILTLARKRALKRPLTTEEQKAIDDALSGDITPNLPFDRIGE